MLNKEIYGFHFDVDELKRKYLLSSQQKLNLELNLNHVLPFYLREIGTDFNADGIALIGVLSA